MPTINSWNSNIPVEISKGGTNATSMANTDGVCYYDGTRLVTTTVGTAGQILTSNGAAVAPTFQAPIPSTCYFLAYQSATQTFNAGSTSQKVIFDVAIKNVGSAYNTSTGVFTCPATGFYFFSFALYFASFAVGTTTVLAAITGSVNSFRTNQQAASGGTVVATGSFCLQMTTNDTIQVVPYEDGTGTFSIYGAAPSSSALSGFTMFSGYRIA